MIPRIPLCAWAAVLASVVGGAHSAATEVALDAVVVISGDPVFSDGFDNGVLDSPPWAIVTGSPGPESGTELTLHGGDAIAASVSQAAATTFVVANVLPIDFPADAAVSLILFGLVPGDILVLTVTPDVAYLSSELGALGFIPAALGAQVQMVVAYDADGAAFAQLNGETVFSGTDAFGPISAIGIAVTGSNEVAIRINCGTDPGALPETDFYGRVWNPDVAYEGAASPAYGYIGGFAARCYDTGPVGGTFDSSLFRTHRAGFDEYRFDVPNGFYTVRLHFAETCLHAAGLRVFDVAINDTVVLNALDVAAQVGKDYAVDYAFGALVEDGLLRVTVNAVTGDAMLSAISVISTDPDATGPPAPAYFEVLGGYDSVILTWLDEPADDLAGYNVYRATAPEGPLTLLNPSVIRTNTYLDYSAMAGIEYFYQIQAVDVWGNEGPATVVLSAAAVDDTTTVIPVYDVFIGPDEQWTLNVDPFSDLFVPGALGAGGLAFPTVDLGYTGGDTRHQSKKSWEIRLPPGETYQDRSTVTLRSEFADESMMREMLSLAMFGWAGVPASTAQYAHVNINDIYAGLFVDAETIDEKFLTARNLDADGSLYEALYGTMEMMPDPSLYELLYAKRNHEGQDYEDLAQFIGAINLASDDAFAVAMHQRLDVQEFLDYYALMILTGNVGFTTQDYYLYHDPQRDKWMVFPTNQTSNFGVAPQLGGGYAWATPIDFGAEGSVPAELSPPNRLVTRMLQVDAFRDHVAARLYAWIGWFFNRDWLDLVIDGLFDYIQFDGRRDVFKVGWARHELFDAGPDALKDYVIQRVPFLIGRLPYFAAGAGPYVYLNEVMVLNTSTVADESGEFEPWVELYNGGVTAVDLGGMYLTNDVFDPTRCRIPPGVVIDGGSHLVIWMDGETASGPTHAAFTLTDQDAILALFAADGVTLLDFFGVGAVGENQSTGRFPDGRPSPRLLASPSPGGWNYRASYAPPVISNTHQSPESPTDADAVTVSCTIEDLAGVDVAVLVYDAGSGEVARQMFDDGSHGDGAAGDGVYATSIPTTPAESVVRYYLYVRNTGGVYALDPPGAPEDVHSYTVTAAPEPIVTPADESTLMTTHVLFTFDSVPGASGYDIAIVADDGSGNPFSNDPAVNTYVHRPRCIVTSGLEFGTDYAWRYRGVDSEGEPDAWQPAHRFSIAPLPNELAGLVSVMNTDPSRYAPGVTLTILRGVPGLGDQQAAVAIDRNGDIVWFHRRSAIQDIRLLRNGHVLFAHDFGACEIRLDGVDVWCSGFMNFDPHEIYDMPNGNILAMVNVDQEVIRDSQVQIWRGHVLTELTRAGQVVWTWNTFDHISTLDLDECFMATPTPSGVYDWLHGNAVVYDAVDDAVYYSIRHLSRIVKINHATGEIIWNMGFDMPSGDADFGDDLFSMQHAPQILRNGHILVYDNGNRRGHSFCTPENPYSTVVELAVDPGAQPPVTVEWMYAQDFFTSFYGDADRLPNGNTLVTAGANGRILEVTPEGTIIWELTAPAPITLYRADRVPSLYPRHGDADGDDDLDLVDFGHLQACFRGENGVAIHRNCLVDDYDQDGDVDLDDFRSFVTTSTGDGN